jgi:hypothetical protein
VDSSAFVAGSTYLHYIHNTYVCTYVPYATLMQLQRFFNQSNRYIQICTILKIGTRQHTYITYIDTFYSFVDRWLIVVVCRWSKWSNANTRQTWTTWTFNFRLHPSPPMNGSVARCTTQYNVYNPTCFLVAAETFISMQMQRLPTFLLFMIR